MEQFAVNRGNALLSGLGRWGMTNVALVRLCQALNEHLRSREGDSARLTHVMQLKYLRASVTNPAICHITPSSVAHTRHVADCGSMAAITE